jgi:O-antigen/teichoic acid export membrane protein
MDEINNNQLSLRQRFLGAGFWVAGSQVFLSVFGMGVTVVLARLLMPEDYGLLAMAMIFIGLLNQTNVVGLGHALVRMEKITAESEELTFSYALIAALALYMAVYMVAPLTGTFFQEPRVVALLRVMSLGFVLRAFYIVPYSLLRREFKMKQQSMIQILGTMADAFSTMALALLGFGVWALAMGPLVSHCVQAVGMAIVRPWHMGLRMRGEESRELIRFAGGVNVSILLWYWYVSADSIFIGRVLGGAALGTFSMAMNLSKLSWNKLWLALNPILLPLFAEAKEKPGELGRVFLRVTHWVALLIFPATFGFMVVAPEAVTVLLSDRWAGAIVPLQWLCLLGSSRALVVLMSPVILAVGNVRLEVLFNLACGVLLPLGFWLALPYGIGAVAAVWALLFPVIAATVLLRAVLRAVELTLVSYLRTLRTPVLAGLVMALVILGLDALVDVHQGWLLAGKIVLGAASYLALVTLLEGNPYRELRRLLADTRAGARR